MNGVDGLAAAVEKAVRNRQTGNARRGVIHGSLVHIGSRAYPFSVAVDCQTEDGCSVWVQLTKNGLAVIVGV